MEVRLAVGKADNHEMSVLFWTQSTCSPRELTNGKSLRKERNGDAQDGQTEECVLLFENPILGALLAFSFFGGYTEKKKIRSSSPGVSFPSRFFRKLN
jgi:hypothetical protein